MPEIRILIVDDHTILREGLRSLLSYNPEMNVIGDAGDGEEALARVAELHPDVVLMDISMKKMNGLEATRLICQHYPETRVLILSQHEEPQYIKPLLQAGASGYVFKRALGADLVTAIQTVYNGEVYLHPGVSNILVAEMRQSYNRQEIGSDSLTDREREILKYIASGKTNSQIAVALSLSVKTVDWHRTNLMNKLNLHNVADLVRYAIQHDLIEN